uniref:Uncharacterized protein n=1 Tax=Trypanosoma congolense (strain IL3000) TaxID=1068625 RepID=G0UR79_TRYCI|nr:hypothetical protein, unlikely [Trypanosoma congolense IL3000]
MDRKLLMTFPHAVAWRSSSFFLFVSFSDALRISVGSIVFFPLFAPGGGGGGVCGGHVCLWRNRGEGFPRLLCFPPICCVSHPLLLISFFLLLSFRFFSPSSPHLYFQKVCTEWFVIVFCLFYTFPATFCRFLYSHRSGRDVCIGS